MTTLSALLLLIACGGEFQVITGNDSLEQELQTGDRIRVSPGDPDDFNTSETVSNAGWTVPFGYTDSAVLSPLPFPEGFESKPGKVDLFFEAVGPGTTVVVFGLEDTNDSDRIVAGGLTFTFTVAGDALDTDF
jgi:hypothetical protein